MERAEPRKIGRLPMLGTQDGLGTSTPSRSAERSLRLSLDETLGESPLMTGLQDMNLPPPVLPRSPLARHAETSEDEDADFVPDDHESTNASSSDMDEEPVWEEPPAPAPRSATRTPAEAPARRTPQRARTPGKRTPGTAGPVTEAAGFYDTIDFDKITDPFTDTRRAFMRGKAQAPPPPRPDVVPAPDPAPAPVAGPSRPPARRTREPIKAITPLRPASTPQRASPVKGAKPFRSPVKGVTPLRPPIQEASPQRASPVQQASPERSLTRETAPHTLPVQDPAPTPRGDHLRSAQSPTSQSTMPVQPERASLPAHASPARLVDAPTKVAPAPLVPAQPLTQTRWPSSPTRILAPRPPPAPAAPTERVPERAAPTRSNRLLTEELLKWKHRCAELEEELDTMQERLAHARGDAHGWTNEQASLQEQVTQLQRGRENDRRAMRQRVRVLESHMADTKIEYDNRYWRLLTSSSDGGDELDSVHVQLVVHQNEVTKLQSELAEQRRRLRLAHEQAAFLAGLYAHRGQQHAATHADDVQQLRQQVADLQQQLADQTAARQAAEAALASQAPAPRGSSVVSAGAAADTAPTLESYGIVTHTKPVGAEVDATSQPATPPPAIEDGPTATPVRASAPSAALRPGMTPMLERAAVSAAHLDAEATPMLSTRVRDEGEPAARKKKRRLIGSGQGFLRLADSVEGLSPTLDVPADLPPLP
ncbi:hypothetical protein MNAN1_002125 [Malassezia nana]|uniref:Uncharacterized protein n=1 Tax=Malassezia nana TaxID=180528 RepID=A0AAF0J2P7_9BASI|nr:hypothetical protein MNAN1_002125 [Malassezia nana]